MRSILIKASVLTFFILAFQFFNSAQTQYYVSALGNDGNQGTEAWPFASISHAKDAIKVLKQKNLSLLKR